MKRIVVCIVLAFALFACSDSANKKSDPSEGIVDTTVIGSDNPMPDTSAAESKTDSLKRE